MSITGHDPTPVCRAYPRQSLKQWVSIPTPVASLHSAPRIPVVWGSAEEPVVEEGVAPTQASLPALPPTVVQHLAESPPEPLQGLEVDLSMISERFPHLFGPSAPLRTSSSDTDLAAREIDAASESNRSEDTMSEIDLRTDGDLVPDITNRPELTSQWKDDSNTLSMRLPPPNVAPVEPPAEVVHVQPIGGVDPVEFQPPGPTMQLQGEVLNVATRADVATVEIKANVANVEVQADVVNVEEVPIAQARRASRSARAAKEPLASELARTAEEAEASGFVPVSPEFAITPATSYESFQEAFLKGLVPNEVMIKYWDQIARVAALEEGIVIDWRKVSPDSPAF